MLDGFLQSVPMSDVLLLVKLACLPTGSSHFAESSELAQQEEQQLFQQPSIEAVAQPSVQPMRHHKVRPESCHLPTSNNCTSQTQPRLHD